MAMTEQVSAKTSSSLSNLLEQSLDGLNTVRTENDRVIFTADIKQVRATPTPKDKIVPAPIVEISNLYAESLREVEKESGNNVGIAVFAGALKALHRVFYIAKRRGLQSVNEEAFACWQTHCLRNFDKKASVAMLIIDAGAGTKNDRDMLRRYGYECPDETEQS